jgi:hypothetical protein
MPPQPATGVQFTIGSKQTEGGYLAFISSSVGEIWTGNRVHQSADDATKAAGKALRVILSRLFVEYYEPSGR